MFNYYLFPPRKKLLLYSCLHITLQKSSIGMNLLWWFYILYLPFSPKLTQTLRDMEMKISLAGFHISCIHMKSGLFKQKFFFKKGITFSRFSLWTIRLETFHFQIQSSFESQSVIDCLTVYALYLLKKLLELQLSDTEKIILILSLSFGAL